MTGVCGCLEEQHNKGVQRSANLNIKQNISEYNNEDYAKLHKLSTFQKNIFKHFHLKQRYKKPTNFKNLCEEGLKDI